MYKIVQSGVGNVITSVNKYSDLLKHHPSKGKQPNRDYETIDGRLEEVTIKGTDGSILIKKDYILYQDGSTKKVSVPCPISGYIKTYQAYGTMEIYSTNTYKKLIGRILHLDTNFLVKTGSYVEYGSNVGYQSGTGASGSISYPIHVHMELEKSQYEKYIADLLSGNFSEKKSDVKPMGSFCFPVVNKDGSQYSSAEEVYKLLEKENSGFYLLSKNNFWHGGIHFSDLSVPHHMKEQSIRCMMDGTVIAYRLNKEYLKTSWGNEQLSYSSSFCLVRHDYISPENTAEGESKGKQNKIQLYSLYMHLLPYAGYETDNKQQNASDKKQLKLKQTIRVRKDGDTSNGVPDVLGKLGAGSIVTLTGENNRFAVQEDSGKHIYSFSKGTVTTIKQPTSETIKTGTVVWVVHDDKYTEELTQTSSNKSLVQPLYWQSKINGVVQNRVTIRQIVDKSKPFSLENSQALGLLTISSEIEFENKDTQILKIDGKSHKIAHATLIKGGYADQPGLPPSSFWVCIDKPFMLLTPQAPTQFDTVVKCNEPIKAGDPIGFMGLYEVPMGTVKMGERTSKHQVHIELFTSEADNQVHQFIQNQAALTCGKQYFSVKAKTSIYVKNEDGKKISFATAGLKTEKDTLLVVSDTKKCQDTQKKEFIECKNLPILNGKIDGYISSDSVENLCQYDLEKLGFQMVQEKNASANGYLDPENLPDFFKNLYAQIDKNKNGILEQNEIITALRTPAERKTWSKLIAKHPSEWHKSTIASIKELCSQWASIATDENTIPQIEHEKQRMDKLEWMSQINASPNSIGPSVWHFHPVELLSYIRKTYEGKNWAHSAFGTLLAQVESNNDYSAYNAKVGNKYKAFYGTNITNYTLSEMIDKQSKKSDGSREIFAAGRYQLIPDTLIYSIKYLSLNKNDKFSPEIQDRIFNEYLIKQKRPHIFQFLEGNGDVEDAIYDWALEFASAGVRKGKQIQSIDIERDANGDPILDPKTKKVKKKKRYATTEGESFYSGDGVNVAHLMPEEMVLVLTESKNNGG